MNPYEQWFTPAFIKPAGYHRVLNTPINPKSIGISPKPSESSYVWPHFNSRVHQTTGSSRHGFSICLAGRLDWVDYRKQAARHVVRLLMGWNHTPATASGVSDFSRRESPMISPSIGVSAKQAIASSG